MKKLIIIGAGGHARAVLSAAKTMQNWEDFNILDINFSNQEETIMGCKVYSFEKVLEFNKENYDYFIAIGDNNIRKSIFLRLNKLNFNFVNILHSKSFIDKDSEMGIGNFFGQFSNMGTCTKIGNFNIINSYGNIEHEVNIGDFNHIAPSSTVCGRTSLNDGIFIGANAVIIEKLSIADNTTIGAGSVVLKSVKIKNQKLLGVPAKII